MQPRVISRFLPCVLAGSPREVWGSGYGTLLKFVSSPSAWPDVQCPFEKYKHGSSSRSPQVAVGMRGRKRVEVRVDHASVFTYSSFKSHLGERGVSFCLSDKTWGRVLPASAPNTYPGPFRGAGTRPGGVKSFLAKNRTAPSSSLPQP